MITRERAVELVEALLEEQRPTWDWARLIPAFAVHAVEEHEVGWLVHWTTAEGARDPRLRGMIHGGPYLVDRHDGSIHYVPGIDWHDDWPERYLRQVKGVRTPDPLAEAVRDLARTTGTAVAMRHLRKHAPRMSLQQARTYVSIVRDGEDPPEELAHLTREPGPWGPPGDIETFTGPADDPRGTAAEGS
ncbi:YrhB domain-containing protein [Kitasatospora sp. NPDC004240]